MSDSDALPSTERFSARVADYLRSRPGYPAEIVTVLTEAGMPESKAIVADIGSGTGLLSRTFLDSGCRVYGVEPGESMRIGADVYLQDWPAFESIAGSAEATGLASDSVDAVVSGQAFHWFNPESARAEWLRIGKTGAIWAVLWNIRRLDASPFLRAYDALLHTWGTDYAEVSATWEDAGALQVLFGGDHFQRRSFEMTQSFDFDGLKGLLLSFSYIPGPDDKAYAPMLEELAYIFQQHATAGIVKMEYDTVMFYEVPKV